MKYFGRFFLDNEKDMIVELYLKNDEMFYVLRTPNHKTGNLITNLAKLCDLELSFDNNGLKIIEGKVPCYIDAENRKIYIFRLGNTKVANIFPSGRIEMKASIPAISKTLMSQTKDYKLDIARTIIKTYILNDVKFRSDLHTHMNANLSGDILIALAIKHQLRYPLYYVKKLNLTLSKKQEERILKQREKVAERYSDSELTGKYLTRKIDDNTFINFADLILNNLSNSAANINKVRASLTILKDGQAVFTNLEKVYLYRYVFTKGIASERKVKVNDYHKISDEDIVRYLDQMSIDEKGTYKNNDLFKDKLLWIARSYQNQGINYVEISDTTLVKEKEAVRMLKEVHEVMDQITSETGVVIRFLASFRRIPLTLVRDQVTSVNYLQNNLRVLRSIAKDPYVAGSDIVGEEINDINELQPLISELVKIADDNDGFVIRIHAGENDGLTDNVENSIRCVEKALVKGQKMPQIRIGHGLYTANLNSAKGRKLMKYIRDNKVVLEFQITSNVRLNNLNSIQEHPLRKYLKAGIRCVQGTDGAAIYGTNCIDEQLSLEKLLNLSHDELLKMKETETEIIKHSLKVFERKKNDFNRLLEEMSIDEIYERETVNNDTELGRFNVVKYDSREALKSRLGELPWDKHPIVLVGGSFNNSRHHTRLTEKGRKLIDGLLNSLDKDKVFFVIGNKLTGYERYLLANNRGFEIYAIVPAMITEAEKEKYLKNNVRIIVSTETSTMGLYKSFNYEIFERRESTVIAIDGNSAGANLIQEAKNGKGKADIYVSCHSAGLRAKAKSLEGYVKLFDWNDDLAHEINLKLN